MLVKYNSQKITKKKTLEESVSKIQNLYNFNKKNKPFIYNLDNYKSFIPLNLYVYWHTKDLPPLINENYKKLVQGHPRFNHYLFDENDARDVIKNNFPEEVLNAFDSLIPSAFKCDLFRYCILYLNGGIYLDIKYECVNNFKLLLFTGREYFVKDLDSSGSGIYNALIVTLPKNQILYKAIYQIVENVKNKFYGINGLEPTGPLVLKRFFTNDEINNLNVKHCVFNNDENSIFYIEFNNKICLKIFKEYRNEQHKYSGKHHSQLYNERNIYK